VNTAPGVNLIKHFLVKIYTLLKGKVFYYYNIFVLSALKKI